MESVLAAVRVAPSKTEIREFPMPDIPPDSALLKMEVAGICGTDVKLYREPPSSAPVIMGHENIGYIARAGSEFTKRQGFKEGDLVFLEHYVSCGQCEWCHLGQYRHCENTDWRYNPNAIRYGYTPADVAPHLWGGFAQYVYLPWNAVAHRVPKGVTPELAGLATPLSNGIEWSLFDGGVGYDSTVLIQGPGQQGLSQTVVCKQAGGRRARLHRRRRDLPDTARRGSAQAQGRDDGGPGRNGGIPEFSDRPDHGESHHHQERARTQLQGVRARPAAARIEALPAGEGHDAHVWTE